MATRRGRKPGEPVYPKNLEQQAFKLISRWGAFLLQLLEAQTQGDAGAAVKTAFYRRYPRSVQAAELRRVCALVTQHTVQDLERLLGVDVPDVSPQLDGLIQELLESVETMVDDMIRLRAEELNDGAA